MVVSVVEETICGVGAVRQNGDLDLCYVHPGWQRRGVGKSLILAMEAQARVWGIHTLRLISTFTARPFYERNGYVFLPEESSPSYGMLYDYRYTKSLQ
jgi:putative acetyltransferase